MARSNSCEVVSTRPDSVAPDARRTVTEVLVDTTCRLVTMVWGAAKKPLPRPSRVSIETIAGTELLTTSSSEDGLLASGGAVVAAGADPQDSGGVNGPGV